MSADPAFNRFENPRTVVRRGATLAAALALIFLFDCSGGRTALRCASQGARKGATGMARSTSSAAGKGMRQSPRQLSPAARADARQQALDNLKIGGGRAGKSLPKSGLDQAANFGVRQLDRMAGVAWRPLSRAEAVGRNKIGPAVFPPRPAGMRLRPRIIALPSRPPAQPLTSNIVSPVAQFEELGFTKVMEAAGDSYDAVDLLFSIIQSQTDREPFLVVAPAEMQGDRRSIILPTGERLPVEDIHRYAYSINMRVSVLSCYENEKPENSGAALADALPVARKAVETAEALNRGALRAGALPEEAAILQEMRTALVAGESKRVVLTSTVSSAQLGGTYVYSSAYR